ALDGCDAAVHAASVFSFDARRSEEMRAVNARGTENVLGTAHRLGLDRPVPRPALLHGGRRVSGCLTWSAPSAGSAAAGAGRRSCRAGCKKQLPTPYAGWSTQDTSAQRGRPARPATT